MTPSPLRSGDPAHLGPYRIVARLGEGGMGSVYLGEDPTGRKVAVKIIRSQLSSDDAFLARFRSEVKRARQVPPFCTAEVLDASTDHAPPYLVVEYVHGPSLADIVRDRGPLARGDLHAVAIGVATALAAIHDAGVVHRDLKPANVLFSALGTPKVIDFGIAKTINTTQHLTEPGQILGTIAYMGPERFDPEAAQQAGPAADIFAWGAVVTYAATGHTPFAPETLIATAGGMALPAPDLAALPAPLRDLVAGALHPDPRRRPDAHQLLERLLKAGAEGNPVIRASLDGSPDLQRAAAAVRHTVALPAFTAKPAARTVAQWLTTVTQKLLASARRLPPTAVAGIAVAAMIAGFAAYPAAGRLASHHGSARPTPDGTALADRDDAADKASRASRQARCTLDGPLEVTPRHPQPFRCPARRGRAEQTIHAQVQLVSAHACAAIWTDITDEVAYRITVCRDRIALDRDDHGRRRPVASTMTDDPFDPAAWHDVEVQTPGRGITVLVDHEQVITKSRTAIPAGQPAVTLGLTAEPGVPADDPVVLFANVAVGAGT